MSGFKFRQPGRPCVGSMSPGDYDNSSNKEKKSETPIADALIAKNKAERRTRKLQEEFIYRQNGREDI